MVTLSLTFLIHVQTVCRFWFGSTICVFIFIKERRKEWIRNSPTHITWLIPFGQATLIISVNETTKWNKIKYVKGNTEGKESNSPVRLPPKERVNSLHSSLIILCCVSFVRKTITRIKIHWQCFAMMMKITWKLAIVM